MKVQVPGRALITTELKKTGRDKRVIETKEKTIMIGPFTTDEVHAKVGGDIRLTMSENYHSVSVGVNVQIPVAPDDAEVDKGLHYCFDKVHQFINAEVKGARAALRKVAGVSDD
jgi:hypothetical protein